MGRDGLFLCLGTSQHSEPLGVAAMHVINSNHNSTAGNSAFPGALLSQHLPECSLLDEAISALLWFPEPAEPSILTPSQSAVPLAGGQQQEAGACVASHRVQAPLSSGHQAGTNHCWCSKEMELGGHGGTQTS